MSLIDRIFIRFDEFKWAQIKRRALFQPTTNRAIQFRNPTNSQDGRAIPTFGAEPGAFGEDWASYRLPKTRPVGPLPIEHENTHGYVNPNSERPLPVQEAYVDPAISSRGARTSESTDQKPISGLHEANYDKAIVLHNEPHKSFQSSKPKGMTIADQIAKEMKNEPYWFGA